MELEMELKAAADLLKSCSVALSVSSGCELFTRFVTRTSLDIPVRKLLFLFLLTQTPSGFRGVQEQADREGRTVYQAGL